VLLQYVRLDPIGVSATDVIDQVKTYVASNFPSMSGFTVYSSITARGRGVRA
jgi:hypothetical protein